MSGTDARAALKHFILSLPKGDRLLMLLYYADGLSVEEIAAVTRQPWSAVETRLAGLQHDAHSAIDGSMKTAANMPMLASA